MQSTLGADSINNILPSNGLCTVNDNVSETLLKPEVDSTDGNMTFSNSFFNDQDFRIMAPHIDSNVPYLFSGDALSLCEYLPVTIPVMNRLSNPVIGSVAQPSSQITPIPENVGLTPARRLASSSTRPPPNGSSSKATNPITEAMPALRLNASKRNSPQKTATSTTQTKPQLSNLSLSTPAITINSDDQAIFPETSTISASKRDRSPDLSELPTVRDSPDE